MKYSVLGSTLPRRSSSTDISFNAAMLRLFAAMKGPAPSATIDLNARKLLFRTASKHRKLGVASLSFVSENTLRLYLPTLPSPCCDICQWCRFAAVTLTRRLSGTTWPEDDDDDDDDDDDSLSLGCRSVWYAVTQPGLAGHSRNSTPRPSHGDPH
eukprot:3913616-Rhodomonas_salina.1